MNDKPMSHVIFPDHRVWSIPANNVRLTGKAMKAALTEYDLARPLVRDLESAAPRMALSERDIDESIETEAI